MGRGRSTRVTYVFLHALWLSYKLSWSHSHKISFRPPPLLFSPSHTTPYLPSISQSFPYRLLSLPQPPPLSLLICLSASTHLSIPHPISVNHSGLLACLPTAFIDLHLLPVHPHLQLSHIFSPFLQLLLPSLASLHSLSHLFSSFHFISKRLPLGARPFKKPKTQISLSLSIPHTQTHTCSYVYTHWSFTTTRLFHSVVTWEESTNMYNVRSPLRLGYITQILYNQLQNIFSVVSISGQFIWFKKKSFS